MEIIRKERITKILTTNSTSLWVHGGYTDGDKKYTINFKKLIKREPIWGLITMKI